ncbi:alanine racemase [Sphingosinicella humi]|uniref:Alanine racemase n=1 Tax=Allosphingosinicella humi TaxID=2068657 RepID=A0A2U2J3Z8_9SPHN|nr:alanine racemase [Sphingosinicella humi]PWG03079.1 alanine racemase [Sphingosinicella humi]
MDEQPLETIETPALLLDPAKLERNIERMRAQLAEAGDGVVLRPHLKTAKSIEVARRVLGGSNGPITVSTLLEAERFAEAGITDILYAVGIAQAKLDRVIEIRRREIDLTIITDNLVAAEAIAAAARASGEPIPVLIEIDSDGHRGGVPPEDRDRLIAIARTLASGGAVPRGVMTHYGGSYDARSQAELGEAARRERETTLAAAATLRAAGFEAPVASIGSTPTALNTKDLDGITEVRAGVYHFFDLVMAGLGVCSIDEIALSVLATVIGHQQDKGWILVDAGWMAMSRDRGTANQAVDQGYGLVCDASGLPWPDLIMTSANQEHGIIAVRPGSGAVLPDLPVGTQLRILPNHACATASQFDAYHVLGPDGAVTGRWPRFNGW